MTKLFVEAAAIITIFAIGIMGWYVNREINSFVYYDSAAAEIVCEMVKPEYLKNPEECE